MKPEWPAQSPWKQHWLLSQGRVFLNHGSFGACPRDVLATQQQLREFLESGPPQFLWRNYEAHLDQARTPLAKFLGCQSADLAFVTNATTAVNAVVRSFPFNPGDEILTTSFDYNACHNVLQETARQRGAKVIVAEIPFPLTSPETFTHLIRQAITPRTRLVMLDHVTSGTALVLPIESLIAELESQGIATLIDGAHAPGMLPLQLEILRPSYYTGNLHKWCCAPKGAAFLWVRQDRQDQIQPAVISHGNNRRRETHSAFQDRFDWAGTFDPTAWFSVPFALHWLGKCLPGGWQELQQHNRQLLLQARRLLCEQLAIQPPCPESMLGTMATLPFPTPLDQPTSNSLIDPLYETLADEYGIEMPVIRLNGKRWFRISAHLHNHLDEYRYLADSIRQLASR